VVDRCGERGSSLFVAMIACVLIGGAVMLLGNDLNDRQRTFRMRARIVALDHLADAAMAETLAGLSGDPAFGGVLRQRLGDGIIWSEVILEDGEGNVRSVISSAQFDGWRGTIEARLDIGPSGPTVISWNRSTRPIQGNSRLLRRKSSSRR
jgi:hypothetical protein